MRKRLSSENTGIISFSLESLGKLQTLTEPGDHTYQGCFFAHRDSGWGSQLQIFRYPCRINAYIAILCTEGNASVISNMRRYTINKNCLVVSMPNDIIQIESWNNCEIYITALDDDFARRMNIDSRKVLSVFFEIQKHPCIDITQEEADCLEEMFCCLLRDMNLFRDTKFYNEIVMNFVSLATYLACSIISKYLEPASENSEKVSTRNEEYYNRFMSLLYRNFKNERNIGFYASRICITPKYLTSLIKKMTGRSANQWINEFVTMEAKHLLKYSKMSIQEIAFYLSFPNQSFFTQYFKRQTGMTPGVYRTQP